MKTLDFITRDFILHQPSPQSPLEIWTDWPPMLDDVPDTQIQAWRDGDNLIVQSCGVDRARRFPAIEEAIWESLRGGGILILCGPSGELARKPFDLNS